MTGGGITDSSEISKNSHSEHSERRGPQRIAVILAFFCFIHPGSGNAEPLALEPFIQPNYLFCGPTALFTLLDYWGFKHVDFDDLTERLFSRSLAGTPNSNLVMIARQMGMRVFSFTGNRALLSLLLADRIPVLVLQNVSKRFRLGHYRIVVGFDSVKNQILLRDPVRRKLRRLSWSRFEQLWKRGSTFNSNCWAMVLVPPFYSFAFREIQDSPVTHLNLGSYHYRRFRFQEAMEEYQRAYVKAPGHPGVIKFYAQVLIRLKQYDRAEELAFQLLKLRPADPVADDLLGLIAFYRGDPDTALHFLERALQKNQGNPENRFIQAHYEEILRFVERK